MADNIPSMLASWDSDLRCRFANRAYKTWFGADPHQMLGTSIRGLLGPTLFALNEPFMRAALSGEEQLFERVIPGPDGVQRHSLARYTPELADGTVVGFFAEVTDVSYLKAAELRVQREAIALEMQRESATAPKRRIADRKLDLIQSVQREARAEFDAESRRRSVFLAQLAHELRIALAPITPGLPAMSQANVPEMSTLVSRQVQVLAGLVDDLVGLAGHDLVVPTIDRHPIDLRWTLCEAADMSATFLEEGQHAFRMQTLDQPIRVNGDHRRLVQVFFNLLNNAAKYTPKGGEVSMTADVSASDVLVSVRDNGIGFSAGSSESIFLGHMPLRDSAKGSEHAWGVGLALARQLVEAHNGSVEARSEGHGKGTVLEVRLPLAKA